MSDRGVSIALSYVLVTSIIVVLVGGLIIAGTSFVDDQRESVIEQELTVTGNQLAGNIEQVDRMVRANGTDDPEAAMINETFREQVSGATYNVRLVEDDGDAKLVLVPVRSDVVVEVNVAVQTSVENVTASGGTISAYYDGENLVITNA